LIKFNFEDLSWIAIRVSGTEPKVKIYLCIYGKTYNESEVKLKWLMNYLNTIINENFNKKLN
jgi:phosphomannomutase